MIVLTKGARRIAIAWDADPNRWPSVGYREVWPAGAIEESAESHVAPPRSIWIEAFIPIAGMSYHGCLGLTLTPGSGDSVTLTIVPNASADDIGLRIPSVLRADSLRAGLLADYVEPAKGRMLDWLRARGDGSSLASFGSGFSPIDTSPLSVDLIASLILRCLQFEGGDCREAILEHIESVFGLEYSIRILGG